MRSRGRGFSRGRVGRSRGARGRARGFKGQSGPSRRFDSERLADKAQESDSGPEHDLPDEQEESFEENVSDEEEEEEDNDESTARPYMSLLKKFAESSAPKAKRRKLGHNDTTDIPEKIQQVDSIKASKPGQEDDDGVGAAEGSADETDDVMEEEPDSEDETELTDPFDVHFAHPEDAKVGKAIEAIRGNDWTTRRGLVQTLRATVLSAGADSKLDIPQSGSLQELKLKQKLQEKAFEKLSGLGAVQQNLLPLIFGYHDIFYNDVTHENSWDLRRIVCLHALNHVFKTRDRVIKDNYKLAKEGPDTELELRDQGFTRPKVLFLLPTRNACAKMISVIRDLCDFDQQENRQRFYDLFGPEVDNDFGQNRPAEFKALFEGNDDDMFRIGVKLTRKSIKYFSQFYSSDVIFASPLGLRMVIGSEDDKKKPDYDFLSSIELVIVDQADALLMQNWEHVEFIFEHLNLQPKDAHGCDFSRLRPWYLEDWAKYFRQTIVTSKYNTPELAELQRAHCHNWAGKIRLQPEYPGMIQQLGVKVKQTFSRFQCASVDKDPDDRWEYFISAVVPTLVKRANDSIGTLLFIPSYLDFVRVRNYFANSNTMSNVTFGAVSEYTDVREASRARSHFSGGRHRVLLYTERAHHFWRYQIRGVQRVIFYGPPENPVLYREIAGDNLRLSEQDAKMEPGRGTVRVMFSKYDVMKLERIVGSRRVGKMMQERGDTFDFV